MGHFCGRPGSGARVSIAHESVANQRVGCIRVHSLETLQGFLTQQRFVVRERILDYLRNRLRSQVPDRVQSHYAIIKLLARRTGRTDYIVADLSESFGILLADAAAHGCEDEEAVVRQVSLFLMKLR